jgi:hypothetical protein
MDGRGRAPPPGADGAPQQPASYPAAQQIEVVRSGLLTLAATADMLARGLAFVHAALVTTGQFEGDAELERLVRKFAEFVVFADQAGVGLQNELAPFVDAVFAADRRRRAIDRVNNNPSSN